MSEDSELRASVAAVHGLPEEAATFLVGSSLQQLEESAVALVRLVGHRRDKPEPPKQEDPLTIALRKGPAQKVARRRALAEALHPRPGQPCDERGRFAAGFDGGARTSMPSRQSPERAHDELLVALAQFALAYGRSGF